MTIQKFNAPEPSPASGFVLTDLAGADAADGVVRCAKKVLVDSARTLARSRTYAWALLERPRSGASAGISAAGDRDAGIAAFLEAVDADAAAGSLVLDAAKGIGTDELDALRPGDPRHPGDDHALLAASVVAAILATAGGAEGRTVAIEGAGPATAAIVQALVDAGARPASIGLPDRTLSLDPDTDPGRLVAAIGPDGSTIDPEVFPNSGSTDDTDATAVLTAEVDVLLCGSKLGLIDHETAAHVAASVIAPIGPAPVTAKGLAVAARRGTTVLPDFVTTAGPLQRFLVEDPLAQREAATAAADRCAEFLEHPDGAYLGACAAAESFLSSWCDELPFGRPLA